MTTMSTNVTEEPVYTIPNLTKIITSILKEIIDEECKDCKHIYINIFSFTSEKKVYIQF